MGSVTSMEQGVAGGLNADDRPIASLSLDADNLWAYMKVHGDPGWEAMPSFIEPLVRHALDDLDALGLRITWFIVGADADRKENVDALSALVPSGHEVANHSYRHEPWLHRYSAEELETEISRAEDAIESVTGVRTTGFRGPGYSLSTATLRVLVRRGYKFDASTLPSIVGPLARAYYMRTTQLSSDQLSDRSRLFGTWRDGLQSIAPYRWLVDGRSIIELPITTAPGLRIPMHMSYLLMLSERSPAVARSYFRAVLKACRVVGVGPSLLLHPLDFLSLEDAPQLGFFPSMGMPALLKRERVREYLTLFARNFRVVPVGEHVAAISDKDLRIKVPSSGMDKT